LLQTAHDFQYGLNQAGIHGVFASRGGAAERSLENAFRAHKSGEVRLTGASLRLFLGPGLHFYQFIRDLLGRPTSDTTTVRAVICSARANHELPVRSFIEEFGQSGDHPRVRPFDWSQPIDFDFGAFESRFFSDHGLLSASPLRVIQDLSSVHAGLTELRGVATSAGNTIDYRETLHAPYCTAVIFPEQAFYTPNLLSADVPVNFPTIVFQRDSVGYRRLSDYFEFQWWLSSDRRSA
jgi:hypothetical protein